LQRWRVSKIGNSRDTKGIFIIFDGFYVEWKRLGDLLYIYCLFTWSCRNWFCI